MRTEENIPRGVFVAEYTGEMISSEVAESRGVYYDETCVSYLMDLDVEGRDNRYWSCITLPFPLISTFILIDLHLHLPLHLHLHLHLDLDLDRQVSILFCD